MGPLALIAKQAGYEVSGSDIKDGQSIKYLTHLRQGSGGQASPMFDIHIGQSREQIAAVHARKPIDWFVYTSAVLTENPDQPEVKFCEENNIKVDRYDQLLNKIIIDHQFKLVAIAGTHGKTTTTAMVIWLFKQLDIPTSHSVGAQISFGKIGEFHKDSQYFVLEADEFDRKFLTFKPYLSIISGLGYDHHEIYKTMAEYNQAFKDFIAQSQKVVMWDKDAELLNMLSNSAVRVEQEDNPAIENIKLPGLYNRRDAWLAVAAVSDLTGQPASDLIAHINRFPGVGRRFERIAQNLYSDDAHTPEKIQGCMNVAGELAAKTGQKIVVIYEPLTNRRMYHLAAAHHDVFGGASAIYWLPSYLAREDPNLPILSPAQLIKNLSPQLQVIAKPMERDEQLKTVIERHLKAGDMVVAMAGGGAGSLDEWLRQHFTL